jgi:glyoxylase-like metal-dependent hydrolase (beta-lactamase superfamily II)
VTRPAEAETSVRARCGGSVVSVSSLYRVTRRTFLTEVGRGMFAIAILGTGVVACTTTSGDETSTTAGGVAPPTGAPDPTTSTTAAETRTTEAAAEGGVTVQQVSLGGVSAYILVRGAEAVIVDTGNPGDAGDVEAGLSEVGLGWGNVGNVILTHRHPDHVGSLGPVMDNAAEAFGYAGDADIPSINAPRPLTPVGDGDTVFGLSIIETPGHTAGSISVYDPIGRVLVVGDAMNGADGGVAGANPRFSDDMDRAGESIKKLAGLDFDAVYFGHGEPVASGASRLVAELAATL